MKTDMDTEHLDPPGVRAGLRRDDRAQPEPGLADRDGVQRRAGRAPFEMRRDLADPGVGEVTLGTPATVTATEKATDLPTGSWTTALRRSSLH
jgi:hypothetical protein